MCIDWLRGVVAGLTQQDAHKIDDVNNELNPEAGEEDMDDLGNMDHSGGLGYRRG